MAKRSKKPKSAGLSSASAQATMDAVIASMKKQFGDNAVMSMGGSNELLQYRRQIPSGSVGLDTALGPMMRKSDGRWQTGFPSGIVEIFGHESAGKSTLCLLLAANANAMGMNVLYVDMEHDYDETYATALGVKSELLYYAQPHSGDQAMTMVRTAVQSRVFGLIVVDSIASLVTESELDGGITDSHVGKQARLMSQSLKFLKGEISECGCTVVFTNQLREKIGITFGNPETTPGGRAMKFYAGVRIRVHKGPAIKVNETLIGQYIVAKVVKNKLGPPFRQADIPLIYTCQGRSPGVDTTLELFELAKTLGILEQNGSYYKFGDVYLQGQDNFVQSMRESPGLTYQIYDTVLTRHMATRGFTPDGQIMEGGPPQVAATMVSQFDPGMLATDEDSNGEETIVDEEQVAAT